MTCLLPQGAGVVGPNLAPVGLLQWQLQLCLLSQVVIVRSKQETLGHRTLPANGGTKWESLIH